MANREERRENPTVLITLDGQDPSGPGLVRWGKGRSWSSFQSSSQGIPKGWRLLLDEECTVMDLE
jgi:hypothetical protein